MCPPCHIPDCIESYSRLFLMFKVIQTCGELTEENRCASLITDTPSCWLISSTDLIETLSPGCLVVLNMISSDVVKINCHFTTVPSRGQMGYYRIIALAAPHWLIGFLLPQTSTSARREPKAAALASSVWTHRVRSGATPNPPAPPASDGTLRATVSVRKTETSRY